MYIIIGCFNWIGYHLTDALLVNGEKVVGVDHLGNPKKEELALNIGRNANFTLYEKIDASNLKELDPKAIFVFDARVDSNCTYSFDGRCFICTNEGVAKNNIIEITPPLLYGEWMERTATGYYQDHTFIKFNSDLFNDKAIYIKDFVYAMVQLIDASVLPDSITYYTPTQTMNKPTYKDELFILPSMPNKKRLAKVDDFYHMNSDFQ
ncbi:MULTISPECIES: hypothetical protein [Paraliobacillus]|uniref:hypothetical protein n=1 Tax=Paraliobacillus TaxID=200903 RepID=UPI000DD403B3|nr:MULTISPECIES: hypothetical protein [Paraliobacillus]